MTLGEVWESLVRLEGVEEAPSMFAERPALWVNGTEVAHHDGGELIDVRLTRAVIRERHDELRADPSVRMRRSTSADWVEVVVDESTQPQRVIDLVTEAVRAHRAAPGTIRGRPRPARLCVGDGVSTDQAGGDRCRR